MLHGNRDPTGMCLRILIPKLLITLHLHYLLVKVHFTELYEWGFSILNIPETHHNTAEVSQQLTRLLAGCIRSNPGTRAAQQPVPAAAQVRSHRLTLIPGQQNLPYDLIACVINDAATGTQAQSVRDWTKSTHTYILIAVTLQFISSH